MRGYSFLEEELKYLLNNMMDEAGVDLLFHAYLCGVDKDGETVKSVSIATKSGAMKITADYCIDPTGDAQIAGLADWPSVLGGCRIICVSL